MNSRSGRYAGIKGSIHFQLKELLHEKKIIAYAYDSISQYAVLYTPACCFILTNELLQSMSEYSMFQL